MIAAGAIAVLGHHPHVLQPIELYRPRKWDREGVIAYSLGNFISNQGAQYSPEMKDDPHGPRREGVLLRIELVRRDYGGGITRVEVVGVDALPLWTENTLIEAKREGERPSIHVVALDRAIANVRRDLARLAATPDPLREKELHEWEALYLLRKKSIRGTLGERFIRELSAPEPSPEAVAGPLPAQ